MIDNSTLTRVKSTVVAKNATISKNTGAIFSILTESVYTMPRQAGIREIISNGLDATVRAKSDRPIEVKGPSALDTSFSVRDFGNGLTTPEVEDLYTSLGASSKKDIEDEIGFFGIGALSPLAYVEQFTVKSFKDGVLDVYSIYAGDNGIPQVAKVASSKTAEPNGLCVSYNIKRGEVGVFTEDIKTILAYIPPERYICGLPVTYYKKTLKAHKDLSISFDDNIFILKRGYYEAIRDTIVMGGVCYEFDHKLFKSSLFLHHSLTIEAPIGAVSVQASREKLRLNAKTTAYIEAVLKYIQENLQKELQKQIDGAKSFIEALSIYERMTIMQLPKIKWNGHELCMKYLLEIMSKYFDVKRKNRKNFYLYGTDEYKRTFYSFPLSNHRFILDDTSAGGLVRVLANDIYYDNTTVCVQKDSAHTEDFVSKFGNFFVEKTSNLPEPAKKARNGKVKTKKYLLKKDQTWNLTFNNCTTEFIGDYEKFKGFYVKIKNKTFMYNDKKIAMSTLFDVKKFTKEDILIIDWEEKDLPPKSSCFFDYFIKHAELEKEKFWNHWLYECLTQGNIGGLLNKFRDDFKNEASKFKQTSVFTSKNEGNSLMRELGLKIQQEPNDVWQKIHKKTTNVINTHYPLLHHLSWSAFSEKCTKDYILTGDQTLFQSCFTS